MQGDHIQGKNFTPVQTLAEVVSRANKCFDPANQPVLAVGKLLLSDEISTHELST